MQSFTKYEYKLNTTRLQSVNGRMYCAVGLAPLARHCRLLLPSPGRVHYFIFSVPLYTYLVFSIILHLAIIRNSILKNQHSFHQYLFPSPRLLHPTNLQILLYCIVISRNSLLLQFIGVDIVGTQRSPFFFIRIYSDVT